jgi:type IV secretory pathway VirB9-like protein
MGGGATSPKSGVNLFGGGIERPIDVDLNQKQDALYEDDGSTSLKPLVVDYKEYDVISVKVRNLAETHIFFPEDEIVEDVLNGDSSVFSVDFPRVTPNSPPTRKNMLIVRLNEGAVGADTSMTAIGRLRENGERRKYLFILSGWSYKSSTLSNFFVFIKDTEEQKKPASVIRASTANHAASQIQRTPEYLREIPFKPTDISFNDYDPQRPEDVTDEELRKIMPEQIWTDGDWTYLQYGERQADIMPWVVVRRVVDGISSPVDYMRHPKKHNVLVVQTVGQNLFLRNGEKRVLCLIWVGGQGYMTERPTVASIPSYEPLSEPRAEASNERTTPSKTQELNLEIPVEESPLPALLPDDASPSAESEGL